MLAVGGGSQAAAALLISAPAYLIPLLHTERGLSLAEAGLLATAPNVGVLLTLILWGAATDRWGERVILVTGLVVAVAGALASVAAASTTNYVALALAFALCGVGGAATSATSGRVVIGWFPPERRGLAMGLRQTSLPLGMAAGALIVPALASGGEIAPPLVVAGSVVAVAALASALFIVNPRARRGRWMPRAAPRIRTVATRRWPASIWSRRCSSCRSTRSRPSGSCG